MAGETKDAETAREAEYMKNVAQIGHVDQKVKGSPTRLYLSKDNLPSLLFRIFPDAKVRLHRSSMEGTAEGPSAFSAGSESIRIGTLEFFNQQDQTPRLKFGHRIRLIHGTEPLYIYSADDFAQGLVKIQEMARNGNFGETVLSRIAWVWEFFYCTHHKSKLGFNTGDDIVHAGVWASIVGTVGASVIAGIFAGAATGGAMMIPAIIAAVLGVLATLTAILSTAENHGHMKKCRAWLKKIFLESLIINNQSGRDKQLFELDADTWEILPAPGARHSMEDDVLWGTPFVLRSAAGFFKRHVGDAYLGVDSSGKMVFSQTPAILTFVTSEGNNPTVDGIECNRDTVTRALSHLGIDLHTPCSLKAVRDSRVVCPLGFVATLDQSDYSMVCVEKPWESYIVDIRNKLGVEQQLKFSGMLEEYAEYVRVLEGVDSGSGVKPVTFFQEMLISEIGKRGAASVSGVSDAVLKEAVNHVTIQLSEHMRAVVRRMEIAQEIYEEEQEAKASKRSGKKKQKATTHVGPTVTDNDENDETADEDYRRRMMVAALAVGVVGAVLLM